MTPEQRLAEYNRMKEEYKDLYSEDVQRSINRMHAKNQKLTEQMDKHTALIDMLAVRYGVEGGDVSQIMEQIEKDDAFFESKAMEEGMTVEQYKKYAKMEAENRRFQEAQEQAANMRQRQDMYARWDREREACEQKYPGFDMEAEVRDNPEFVRLLGSGVDVTSAYQAVHFDDIMRGVIKSAEASTKKRVVDTVRAGVARPAENAAGSTQPSVTSIDINGMSKEEFAKLVADIQSGKVKTL